MKFIDHNCIALDQDMVLCDFMISIMIHNQIVYDFSPS